MSSKKRSAFDEFCREAFELLDEARVPFLVIGGLAVIAVGEPRTTADVDVIVYAPRDEMLALASAASRSGFVAPLEAETARLDETGTLRFTKGPFQLDIIAASLPFEDEALARAMKKKLFGAAVRLPTPEDLLLLKVVAGRDKDMLDAAGIIRRHRAKLDVHYVERHLRDLCELAEDMSALRRFQDVLEKSSRSRG